MEESHVDSVWKVMVGRLGSDLRAVTQYEGTDVQTRLREDVREQYTSEEDYDLITEVIVNQMSGQKVDSHFKTGDMEGLVRVFESAWVITCPDPMNWKNGLLVSIDRNSTATIEDVQAALDFLSSDVLGPD